MGGLLLLLVVPTVLFLGAGPWGCHCSVGGAQGWPLLCQMCSREAAARVRGWTSGQEYYHHHHHRHHPLLSTPLPSISPSNTRRVGENNGIRFPREFALLIKQLLYFDRCAGWAHAAVALCQAGWLVPSGWLSWLGRLSCWGEAAHVAAHLHLLLRPWERHMPACPCPRPLHMHSRKLSVAAAPHTTTTTTCPAPRSYNRILAPQLRVFDDQRINLRAVDLDYDLS